MSSDRTGDGFRGLTTRLLVLFLAMVVAGFVIPSPGVSAPEPFHAILKPDQRPALYRPMAGPAAPRELVVRSLGIRAPILPIQLEGTVLTPPADPQTVGWWDVSARPGARRGNTVVTGHTVHTGGGQMDRLGTIERGALVQIKTPRGTMNYEATRVIVYTKAELAAHSTELFTQERKHNRLVLITCTGWTGVDYTSNVIVFAEPLGIRNAPRRQTGNDVLADGAI
ncbi:MAG TPA: class F sortase [Marmoricola sp.]|nr:class F sortase [Marmoricola sp.]